MSKTAEKNNIKPDTILKTFWRDNDHFADLFNAALFDGEQVLNPADLMEVDTDVSSMVKFNNHAETIQKVLDVFNLSGHFDNFTSNIFDIKGIVYFLSVIAVCLFLTTQSILKRRWN